MPKKRHILSFLDKFKRCEIFATKGLFEKPGKFWSAVLQCGGARLPLSGTPENQFMLFFKVLDSKLKSIRKHVRPRLEHEKLLLPC